MSEEVQYCLAGDVLIGIPEGAALMEARIVYRAPSRAYSEATVTVNYDNKDLT